MSRVLWVDAFAGIAGDMFLGALLDLGADPDTVRAGLDGLGLSGWDWTLSRVMRGPLQGLHVSIHPTDSTAPQPAEQDSHSHSHNHSHNHNHSHSHSHSHSEPHFPGQPERSWRTIRALLTDTPLPPRARSRALSVFRRLAEAEARVHGMDVEAVVFHEVGAVDAIVDIVGVCLALEALEVDRVVAGPLPVGRGMTRSAHGPIPLPAPATLFLLEGWPVVPGIDNFEQVTPTGAALLTALAMPGSPPAMTVRATGHGAGTKDHPALPNLLRATLGEGPASSPVLVSVLTAQMDDLAGEQLPALIDALLESGALDVTVAPVHMKKGRMGWRVEALAPPALASSVGEALLRHGSSFGLRRREEHRQVLDRHHREVETPWGPVRVKIGLLEGEVVHVAPEHADVRARARDAGVAERRVHLAAAAAAQGGVDAR